MLSGVPPFYEDDQAANQWAIMHKIAGTELLPYLDDRTFSEEAINFVYSCLKRDPEQRPKIQDLIKHPFVTKYSKNLDEFGREVMKENKAVLSAEEADQMLMAAKGQRSYGRKSSNKPERSVSPHGLVLPATSVAKSFSPNAKFFGAMKQGHQSRDDSSEGFRNIIQMPKRALAAGKPSLLAFEDEQLIQKWLYIEEKPTLKDYNPYPSSEKNFPSENEFTFENEKTFSLTEMMEKYKPTVNQPNKISSNLFNFATKEEGVNFAPGAQGGSPQKKKKSLQSVVRLMNAFKRRPKKRGLSAIGELVFAKTETQPNYATEVNDLKNVSANLDDSALNPIFTSKPDLHASQAQLKTLNSLLL